MKQEKTNDELIAQFMGEKIRAIANDGTVFLDGKGKGFLPVRCAYNKSWDALMPVWFKFRGIEPSGFLAELAEHDNWMQIIGSAILYDDIEDAYSKMVEGINWYNQNRANP